MTYSDKNLHNRVGSNNGRSELIRICKKSSEKAVPIGYLQKFRIM